MRTVPSLRARIEAVALRDLERHGRVLVRDVADTVGCARSTARRWLGQMPEIVAVAVPVRGPQPGPRWRTEFLPRPERHQRIHEAFNRPLRSST